MEHKILMSLSEEDSMIHLAEGFQTMICLFLFVSVGGVQRVWYNVNLDICCVVMYTLFFTKTIYCSNSCIIVFRFGSCFDAYIFAIFQVLSYNPCLFYVFCRQANPFSIARCTYEPRSWKLQWQPTKAISWYDLNDDVHHYI